MGVHYNVFIFDDHLGLLNGRSIDEEVAHINKALADAGAIVFQEFKYIKEGGCIIGELRKSDPTIYRTILNYDAVYYMADNLTVLDKL